jgi:DUF1680 family protein
LPWRRFEDRSERQWAIHPKGDLRCDPVCSSRALQCYSPCSHGHQPRLRLVNGFAATIDSNNYWYPSLKASTASPAYNLDKILIGLLDAHQFAGVSPGLDLARTCIKGSIRYMPDRAYERFEAPKQAGYDETYTLPENLLYAYELTGADEYRTLARKYLMDATYFDPLSRGENVLPGLHAYSHVNALCSAARAYSVMGDTKYLRAIQNAWDMIESKQSFASGGWAPEELFVEPSKGLLGESLAKTRAHFETPCGSYAHLKLARYLLRFTGNARYGDSLERVLYNTVLGAKDPSGDGHVYYYSDYHQSAQKQLHRDLTRPLDRHSVPQNGTRLSEGRSSI